jgi:ABC-type multidrug transport system permease subunit
MSPRAILRVLVAFVRRDVLVQLSYRTAFLAQLGALATSVLTVYFLARFIDAGRPQTVALGAGGYFAFALTGLILADYASMALRSFSSAIRSAMTEGQLEAMLATPAPPLVVLMGSGLHGFLWAGVRTLLLLGAGALFGVRFSGAGLSGLALVLVLTVLATSAVGVLGVSLTLVLKRGEPITSLFATASVLLGGVLYPRDSLPGWVQHLAAALPTSHATDAARAMLSGAGAAEWAMPLAWLAGLSLVLWPLAVVAARWAVVRVRIDGSACDY